ncbi:glucose-1-phosphate adenylyltransferase [Tuwongella immobilis]|uniref:Nucleotidyl transferase domain-containing protein n=1 Tax=Tuwongella immobilis TaxID=692036 RepID=A0A6C2YVM4_9BACT|nr:glucose-1-phosphate adenylyltransferase [Tuwongella immobilis]VIP05670.1 glucose-1-phosphate adenylyltransferase : Glucose-1-phosphate adenylyltransferase OS=Singulisphaera acidiphila (strain ATCC BAA-1392 / DSM 18658 / VKM B-2454 / MOB10) GN=Sinac_1511 PE=3 SV=1: NTP_transferase [Tuwongella immobilis]VTS08696.1 glucose-1-phosphate adenylyltransferase : Glucose-1-phosphate adenylyltransferase OS=Singulisphaera acidiphila (strain ATCC BAA-1392 / DSM 18658 / VKM B-2454 / MOB10) GN=Sinac_1511 PE=
MQSTLCLILGGGRGTRLYPLTKSRSKPAVPVGGKYRLIDIPISNCINSGFNQIYVLTQFLSASLNRHIANTYKFDMFGKGFVEILAAQQTNESANWYQGTADAIRQNRQYFDTGAYQHVMILSGDQLYRMDFQKLMDTHRESKADVTLAMIPVPKEQTSGFGLIKVDSKGRVNGFTEKPKTDAELQPFYIPGEWIERQGVQPNGRNYLASMGIYLFNTKTLIEMLDFKPLATDFGKEVFPRHYNEYRVQAHLFDGYWEDLGTIKSYHEASLALAGDHPPFDFHSPDGVIFTRMRYLPASRIVNVTLDRALVADGCVILDGTKIVNTLIGVRSRIGRNVVLKDTVLIGADRFETDAERDANRTRGVPDLGIGDGSVIQNALIDKDARIGRNVKILNEANVQEFDSDCYSIRDGIVVIPRGTVIPDNTVI